MNIQILHRNEIDSIRWDRLVESSAFAHPCHRSAYLDAVCPHWSAAVMGDMEAAMPVWMKRKWGIWYAAMPPFVQQTGCISAQPASIDKFLQCIQQKARLIELSGNETDKLEIGLEMRSNYCLDISPEYRYIRNGYNDNTKRNCSKAEKNGLHMVEVNDTDRMIRFFEQNNKKNKLDSAHFKILNRLLNIGSNSLSKCYETVDNKNNTLAMAIFTNAMGRHVYTLASLTEQGRLQGAMFMLIDKYILMHSGMDEKLLDFEGSNIAGVAQFYAGFGATNRPYPFIQRNNLPWPLRIFKR